MEEGKRNLFDAMRWNIDDVEITKEQRNKYVRRTVFNWMAYHRYIWYVDKYGSQSARENVCRCEDCLFVVPLPPTPIGWLFE